MDWRSGPIRSFRIGLPEPDSRAHDITPDYVASKSEVLICDYVDTGNPVLERMWEKRQRGYRAMGYRVDAEGNGVPSEFAAATT